MAAFGKWADRGADGILSAIPRNFWQPAFEETLMTQLEYNLEIVRELLNNAFDVGELRLICLNNPEFRAVYDDYSDARKSELLLRLIEHAERKVHIARLLEIAKEKAPGAYAKFEDRLVRHDGAARPAAASTTAQPSLAADLGIAFPHVHQHHNPQVVVG